MSGTVNYSGVLQIENPIDNAGYVYVFFTKIIPNSVDGRETVGQLKETKEIDIGNKKSQMKIYEGINELAYPGNNIVQTEGQVIDLAGNYYLLAILRSGGDRRADYQNEFEDILSTISNTNSPVNINSIANSNSNIFTNSNIDTSGWKTYTNTKYEYTFKYPKDWVVENKKATSGFFYNEHALDQVIISDSKSPYASDQYDYYDSCNISAFTKDNNQSIEEWINGSEIYVEYGEGVHQGNSAAEKNNNLTGLLVEEGGPNVTTAVSFYFVIDGYIFRYGYFTGMDIDHREVFNQYKDTCMTILSTLKGV